MAGIGLVVRLREAGITDVVVLERAERVGGTWRDNAYPGCACDVPSQLYSFSFAPNPDWSHAYSERDEILAYVEDVAERHAVHPQIRFGCTVECARWDDPRRRWVVETSRGTLTADVLISAMGPFGDPVTPDFVGRERFRGTATHTFGWQPDRRDIDGRRVAVIGTGASAVQVIPAIAPDAERVLVFQRTPCWIMPRINPRSTRLGRRLRRLAPVRLLERAVQYAAYESYGSFNFVDRRFAYPFEAIARLLLRLQVRDRDLRRRLTPDYRIGCKRAAVSGDYLPAFGRPNVELVGDRIVEITERGLRTADGRAHEVDTIVFATGFSLLHETTRRIVGRDGRSLADVYEERPQSYLGTSVAGFPNFFFTSGPFAGAGNQSFLYMLESQFAYVVHAIATMRAEGLEVIDVEPRAQEEFVREAEARSAGTIWLQGGCSGYYTTADGTRNAGLWPDWSFNFRRRTRRFAREAYAMQAVAPATADPALQEV